MQIEDEIKFSKATKVSDEAKDFILICLEKDPRDRYTLP
jgi:serine/threonine protein kinase